MLPASESYPIDSAPGHAWHRGAFLSERIVKATAVGSNTQDAGPLVERWRREAGLNDDALFGRRLAADEVDLSSFRSLLTDADSPEVPGDADWLRDLGEVLDGATNISRQERHILDELTSFSRLSGLCRPFLLWSMRTYERRWEALGAGNIGAFAPEVLTRSFLSALAVRLATTSFRAIVLELNVARLRGDLLGGTPEEKFQYFIEERTERRDDVIRLLEEYPVLARLLIIQMRNWVDATAEAVERFCRDKHLLRDSFGAGFTKVVGTQVGVSDPHRGGRGVMIFDFEGGARLVYKPKSLAASEHFQDLLRWLNERGASPRFPVLSVLNRGEYGWEQFVQAGDCASAEQVRRFYLRQGGYLALLYLVGGSDFHRDNVIAAGENPYLIDLEALFDHVIEKERGETAAARAWHSLRGSVLSTGLLPFLVGDPSVEGKATDFGGLSSAEGQSTPTKVLQLEGAGKDTIRAVRKHAVLEQGHHLPRLNGDMADVNDFPEELLRGFENTYRLLLDNRNSLRPLLMRFREDPVRKVFRNTYLYHLFLEGGHHPDFLRNGIDRDRFMDRLWAGIEHAPRMEPLVTSEREDLLVEDIPYFYSTPGSLDLWDSRGRRKVGFFEVTGLAAALDRLGSLSEVDCEEQKQLIGSSLGTRSYQHAPSKAPSRDKQSPSAVLATQEEFLEAAVKVGDRLEEKAIWGRGRRDAIWVGMRSLGGEQWDLSPSDVGLYEGLSGIALFLAYLARASGQDRFRRLAEAAMRSAEDISRDDLSRPGVSAFQGRTSLIYAMNHLSVLWDEPRLLERALQEARLVRDEVTQDKAFDLLSGVAGATIPLLQLHELTGSDLPREAAILCGEHLIANARKMAVGHGWKVPSAAKPLSGLSHGAAGMAWSLASLYRVTGEQSFREMALSALEYERSLYDSAQHNWLDLRVEGAEDGPHAVGFGWCNGAPGIGLGRLLCLDLLPDEHMHQEIRTAVDTTLRSGFGGTHCLCHGDLGNLELLLLAADKLAMPGLVEKAYGRGAGVLGEVRRQGRWRTGWPYGGEPPGLMIGLAGIGYGFLRLATNRGVPSLICLEPPPETVAAPAPGTSDAPRSTSS